MSPEELAETRHYAACYQVGYVHSLMHSLLDHIDQQAARIAALEAQVAGLREIAITATSRAIYEECQGDCGRVICSPEKHKKDARRRLSEECPEVFG